MEGNRKGYFDFGAQVLDSPGDLSRWKREGAQAGGREGRKKEGMRVQVMREF